MDCCGGLSDYLLVAGDTAAAKAAESCLRKFFEHSRRDAVNIFGIRQASKEGILSLAGSPSVIVQARVLFHMARAFEKRDPELAKEARKRGFASTYWVLGINPYGRCLLSEAGSRHVQRYLSYYYPDEFPGSIMPGIVPEKRNTDVPYMDVRNRSKYRGRGDGQTGEPAPWITGRWLFMLSDLP
jgi:hypothetical protein